MQISNYTVAFITPTLISEATYSAYYLFGACTLIGTIICAFFMFETRGYTLEAIEQRYAQGGATASGIRPLRNFRLRRLRVVEA